MAPEPQPPDPIQGTRVLAVLGDSVTTDHISPAGAIKKDSPAGRWLIDQGTEVRDFNSYGSRRGNHEVMIRGTFANVRLRNRLVDREGGFTLQFPDGEGVESLGLTGEEVIDVEGLDEALDADRAEARKVRVSAARDGADPVEFEARVRIDTPNEVRYYRNGGILQRVLRDLR